MENPLKEFTYRRQIVLKAAEKEKTGRLLGFLDWMESVPTIASLLKTLRGFGGTELLRAALHRIEEERRNRWHSPKNDRPPDANS